MNTELPEHIIEKLIELGKSDKIDDPAISADFEQFRSYSKFGCYSMEWLIPQHGVFMDIAALQTLLTTLISHQENEVIELKNVGDTYTTSDIGKIFHNAQRRQAA